MYYNMFCIIIIRNKDKRTKKQKKKFLLSNWEFFVWNWENNILFGIGNGAEFRPPGDQEP